MSPLMDLIQIGILVCGVLLFVVPVLWGFLNLGLYIGFNVLLMTGRVLRHLLTGGRR